MMKQHLLFLVLLITPFFSFSSLRITELKKAVTAVFLEHSIAIGEEDGCTIRNASSGDLIYQLTEKETYQIVTTKDKKKLAIADQTGLYCFDTQTETIKELFILPERPAIAFSVNNKLFAYTASKGQLRTYDGITSTYANTNNFLEWEPHAAPVTTISCHPTKNEFIYPSKSNRLSIAQLSCNPLITTHLEPSNLYYCTAGEYSSDGRYIAINEHIEKCFIYDTEQNTCLQLCADNQKYLAMTFHPHTSIIALLTHNSIVHYFNYKTGTLIAATVQLTPIPSEPYKQLYKRLDFSKSGTQIVIALGKDCFVLPTPHYNFTAYSRLCHNNLPRELRQIIVHLMIKTPMPLFSYFNWIELSRTEQIANPTEPSNTQEHPMELETDIRKFAAIYSQQTNTLP